jgi:hypothetical protein
VLVALHVVLLALLVRHPEHSVVLPFESSTMTTSLSALLQVMYTVRQYRLTEHYPYLHSRLSYILHSWSPLRSDLHCSGSSAGDEN